MKGRAASGLAAGAAAVVAPKGKRKGAATVKEAPLTEEELRSLGRHENPRPTSPTAHERRTENIPLSQIRERDGDARRVFTDIEELAASIREQGVLEAICVRPLPEGPCAEAAYEIVYGHRRFRAAGIAHLVEIPCVVRDLNDEETAEVAAVENLQRADLTPLEEAEAYRQLFEDHGLPIPEIAARVGRTAGLVTLRLRLLSLAAPVQAALREGRIGVAAAQEISRLSSLPQQEKVLAELLDDYPKDEPPPLFEVRDLVRRSALLLDRAPFDPTDATLVPWAGACGACPKRTAAQASLFGDATERDDRCTDEGCFGAKRTAARERLEAEAKEVGHRVLPESEAKKIFSTYSNALAWNSHWVDLGEEEDRDPESPDDEKDAGSVPVRKNAELLAQAGKEIPVVVAVDPSGGVHRLVDKRDFAAAVGRPLPPEPRGGAGARVGGLGKGETKAERERRKAEEAEREAKEERARETFAADLAQLVARIEEEDPNDITFWHTLAVAVVRATSWGPGDVVAERRSLKAHGHQEIERGLLELARTLDVARTKALIVELLSVDDTGAPSPEFKEFREALGAKASKGKGKKP